MKTCYYDGAARMDMIEGSVVKRGSYLHPRHLTQSKRVKHTPLHVAMGSSYKRWVNRYVHCYGG